MRTPISPPTVVRAMAVRRAAALIVLSLMSALPLSGCGSDDKPSATSTPAAASKSSPTFVTDLEIATYVSTEVTGHDLVDGTDVTELQGRHLVGRGGMHDPVRGVRDDERHPAVDRRSGLDAGSMPPKVGRARPVARAIVFRRHGSDCGRVGTDAGQR
jgi:hypothetical protein